MSELYRWLVVLVLCACAGAASATELPTLWIIGDSTVKNGSGTGTNDQWGWGDPIARAFDPKKVKVMNRAIGGRSSRTFITEGRWDSILNDAQVGDFVVLQFGHNDPGAINDDSRARGTLRGIGEETEEIDNLLTKKHEIVHTYGWYLRKIVRDCREKGLIPVICSYVPRCPRPGDAIDPNPAPTSYRLWAQQVATQEGAAYIDLYALIWAEYAKLTPEAIKTQYFTAADFTHTNLAGAQLNADKVVAGLRALPRHPLAAMLNP